MPLQKENFLSSSIIYRIMFNLHSHDIQLLSPTLSSTICSYNMSILSFDLLSTFTSLPCPHHNSFQGPPSSQVWEKLRCVSAYQSLLFCYCRQLPAAQVWFKPSPAALKIMEFWNNPPPQLLVPPLCGLQPEVNNNKANFSEKL